MPNVHIAIGEKDARKTATLRCLTGFSGRAPLKKKIDIQLTNGTITAVIRLAALQEGPPNQTTAPHVYSPSDLTQLLIPEDAEVVIALRVSGTKYCHFDALDYIDHLKTKPHWNVKSVALLGTAALPLRGHIQKKFPNALIADVPSLGGAPATLEPSNSIASKIRKIWGWK